MVGSPPHLHANGLTTMTDLDLSAPLRIHGGRARREPRVSVVGPITEADLALMAQPLTSSPPAVQTLRDSHHRLARCLAAGMTPAQAGAQTGYSQSRISILQADASFRDLIEVYRRQVSLEAAQYTDVALGNMVLGERLINESLEAIAERDEPLPLGDLRIVREIVADRQDRFGFPKQSVNHNVNHGFAEKLAAARRRANEATRPTGGLIEGEALPHPSPPKEPVT